MCFENSFAVTQSEGSRIRNGQLPLQGPDRLAGQSSRCEQRDLDPTQPSPMQVVGGDEAQCLLVFHHGSVRELHLI